MILKRNSGKCQFFVNSGYKFQFSWRYNNKICSIPWMMLTVEKIYWWKILVNYEEMRPKFCAAFWRLTSSQWHFVKICWWYCVTDVFYAFYAFHFTISINYVFFVFSWNIKTTGFFSYLMRRMHISLDKKINVCSKSLIETPEKGVKYVQS